jgi:hypothetical protein
VHFSKSQLSSPSAGLQRDSPLRHLQHTLPLPGHKLSELFQFLRGNGGNSQGRLPQREQFHIDDIVGFNLQSQFIRAALSLAEYQSERARRRLLSIVSISHFGVHVHQYSESQQGDQKC